MPTPQLQPLSPEDEAKLDAIEAAEAKSSGPALQPFTREEEAALDAKLGPDEGAGSAFVTGATQGASFGTSDEAAGFGGWLADKLNPHAVPIAKERGMRGALAEESAYDRFLAEERARIARAREQHPTAYWSGEVGGGVLASGGATGGAMKLIGQGGRAALAARAAAAPVRTAAGLAGTEGLVLGTVEGGARSEEEGLGRIPDALRGGITAAELGLLSGAGVAKAMPYLQRRLARAVGVADPAEVAAERAAAAKRAQGMADADLELGGAPEPAPFRVGDLEDAVPRRGRYDPATPPSTAPKPAPEVSAGEPGQWPPAPPAQKPPITQADLDMIRARRAQAQAPASSGTADMLEDVARTADGIPGAGKVAATAGLASRGMRAVGSVARRVADVAPEKLGAFGPVLRSAAARGPRAYAIEHFKLSQEHPELAEIERKLAEEEEQQR